MLLVSQGPVTYTALVCGKHRTIWQSQIIWWLLEALQMTKHCGLFLQEVTQSQLQLFLLFLVVTHKHVDYFTYTRICHTLKKTQWLLSNLKIKAVLFEAVPEFWQDRRTGLSYVNIADKEESLIPICWNCGVSLAAQVAEHLSTRALLYDLNKQNTDAFLPAVNKIFFIHFIIGSALQSSHHYSLPLSLIFRLLIFPSVYFV